MPKPKGAKDWTTDEVDAMLSHARELLSAGGNEWETVAERFNALPVVQNRDTSAIKRKFNSMANKPKPTGIKN